MNIEIINDDSKPYPTVKVDGLFTGWLPHNWQDDRVIMDATLKTHRDWITALTKSLVHEPKVAREFEPQAGGMDKFIKASELKFKTLEVEASPQRSRLGRVFDFVPMSSQTREDLSYILDDIDEDVKEMKAKGTDSFTVNAVAGSRLVRALATLFWGALKGIFSHPLPSQSRDKSRSDE